MPFKSYVFMQLIHISEGFRIFSRRLRLALTSPKRYNGNPEEICRQIIEDCWNKRYFQASAGHFCEFWTRDFAWCIEPLIRLGHGKRVEKTLKYALGIFSKDKIRTTISPKGKAFDFPYYAVDSVPYFVYCLRVLGDYGLIMKYKTFLNKQIGYYNKTAVGRDGLVRRDRHFSSMKDYAKRTSSCYGNVMIAMLKDEINRINKKHKLLDNPFTHDYRKLIKNIFWNGKYFLDDLSGRDYVAGDANIFPFLFVFNDRAMLRSSIKAIQDAGLDRPVPLKYTQKNAKISMISLGKIVPDYEVDSVWMHMGPLYIKLVKQVDKKLAGKYIEQYDKLIMAYRNFFELFRNNKPYSSLFYHADESMLWAAMYLDLK